MPLPVRRSERSSGQTMQRWDPFREFEQLQQEMERVLEGVWSQTGAGNGGDLWVPLADVEETDDAWVIEAEAPGASRDDINVELHDSELVITGEIKEKERTGVLRRRTRRTGRFEYRVTLPGPADEEHVEASLHDGVLTVRVPKSEAARARRIEVKAD
jgi:HSP20 family protein